MFAFILPFLAFGLAFVVTAFLLPEIIKIANRYGLQDEPNERKVHQHKIPTFGGIAIFFGFIVASLIGSLNELSIQMQYFLGSIILIVIVGMRDDFLALSARWKFIGQIAAAFVLVHFAKISIGDLDGLFGVYQLPVYVNYPLSIFVIVGITNAYNLIDGVNGLAGTVSLVVLFLLGTWFYLAGNPTLAVFCYSMSGAIVAFLRLNYTPARIFMGDTGSLLLGFSISGLIFLFLDQNIALEGTGFPYIASPVSAGLVMVLYPAFDTFRVFVIRVYEGRSPFSADQNHIHHLLLQLGYSHMRVTKVIVLSQLLLISSFLYLSFLGWNENILVATMIFIVLVVIGILQLIHYRRTQKSLSPVRSK